MTEEEHIEQVAHGMYDAELRFFPPTPWAQLPEHVRLWWRKTAYERLSLAGLLPPPTDAQIRFFRETICGRAE